FPRDKTCRSFARIFSRTSSGKRWTNFFPIGSTSVSSPRQTNETFKPPPRPGRLLTSAGWYRGDRRALLNVTQLDAVFETWLPEDLEIRVSDAEKRSHLRQESSFATLHSSLEELFQSTP